MSLVRVQLWEPKRADDKSHLLFVVLAIYTAWPLIKMELVNGAKRSESRKKKTVQCTVFPAWPLAASPTVGAKESR